MTTQTTLERRHGLSQAKIALLEKRLRGEMETLKIVAAPEKMHEPFPMTEMTEAQWTGRSEAYELGGQSAHAYCELFDGDLDVELFNKIWQRMIDRHPVFREIVLPEGKYKILESVPPYKIEVTDIRHYSPEEKQKYLEAVRDRMRRDIFPGDKWPLFELRVTWIEDKVKRLHMSLDLLITDVGSLQMIGKEIQRLYENPNADIGPDPVLTYRDYNVAIAELRKGRLYKKSESYWLKRLDTLPPAPELALTKRGDEVEHPYFGHRTKQIDIETWARFKEKARRAGLTPDVTANCVFADIIAMWAKRPEFTLNILSFKRLPIHDEVYRIAGNFGSTILLEVRSNPNETFLTRAKRLHQQLISDLDHWYYSGVSVLRELNRRSGGRRVASMPVVFASTLNYSSGDDTPTLMGNDNFWKRHIVGLYLQTPQVWLDHQIAENDGVLDLEWDSVEELYPEGMPQDMLDAYAWFYEELANNEDLWHEPGRNYLLPKAHQEVIAATNATDAPVPQGLLHTVISEQAAKRPQQTAVVSARGNLTYGELERRSNQIGRWLREHGARPNRLVAVVMEKGWEQVAGVLGVLKSGAAYLPIDPEIPQHRLHYLLENGEADTVLTQSDFEHRIEWPAGARVLAVDGKGLEGVSDAALDSVQKPEDLAYVIYTSGSTGQPKGVMIDHRGALNTIVDINERYSVGPEDRVLAISALTFDLSVYDIFGLLAAGGTVVLPKAAPAPDPAQWVSLLREQKITVWNSVPALIELVVDHAESRSEKAGDSLRLALLSGDWIPVSLPDRIRAMFPKAEVISLGGATEASIWSILYPIGTVNPKWTSIPYGRPMKNQKFYIFNELMEPRPFWVPGYLYIGGIGLAKGYWHDEEKTNASFVTHPETGERLYRTGDLGRYLPDGTIEFLGREDTQVKVRGYRIELGEIEEVLLQHPAVQTAVVVASGETSENRRLVAYLVAKPGAALPETEELIQFAGAKLPDYMVPAAFVPIEVLPLTPNGKVDRKALADPERVVREQQKGMFVAPRNATEEEIARIWSRLLGVEKVGIHDNFFNLGGTSLMVNQVVSRIYDSFGVELPLRSIFDSPTVAEMAVALEEASQNEGGTEGFMTAAELASEAVLDPTIGKSA